MRHRTLSEDRTEQSQQIPAAFNKFVFAFIMLHILRDPGLVTRVGKKGCERFQNGRESPREATVNELVPQLIQMLVSHWAQKHQKYFCAQSEASISRSAFVIFLYKGFCMQTQLFAVPVWHLSLREEFSAKMGSTKRKKSHNR